MTNQKSNCSPLLSIKIKHKFIQEQLLLIMAQNHFIRLQNASATHHKAKFWNVIIMKQQIQVSLSAAKRIRGNAFGVTSNHKMHMQNHHALYWPASLIEYKRNKRRAPAERSGPCWRNWILLRQMGGLKSRLSCLPTGTLTTLQVHGACQMQQWFLVLKIHRITSFPYTLKQQQRGLSPKHRCPPHLLTVRHWEF